MVVHLFVAIASKRHKFKKKLSQDYNFLSQDR